MNKKNQDWATCEVCGHEHLEPMPCDYCASFDNDNAGDRVRESQGDDPTVYVPDYDGILYFEHGGRG